MSAVPEFGYTSDLSKSIDAIHFPDYTWTFHQHDEMWWLDKKGEGAARSPPTDDENTKFSLFHGITVTWIPSSATPIWTPFMTKWFIEKSPHTPVEKRLCYFYFGNDAKDGGDYPAGKLSDDIKKDIKYNDAPVLKLGIGPEKFLRWYPITLRPEDEETIRLLPLKTTAGLMGYKSLLAPRGLARRRHGGTRKRSHKRRRTVRRSKYSKSK